MKIVLTGGGSGGHFYPLIAVVQEINEVIKEQHLVAARFYYFSDTPYDSRTLFQNEIEYRSIYAGKVRRYFSILNAADTIKTFLGILTAIWKLFWVYPDLVFSKGGYAAFPTLVAARLLRIPVVIHESDAHPGRVSIWSGRFARRIGLAFPEALTHFPAEKSAIVGNPIRREILEPAHQGAYEFLQLEKDIPTILILGGSQGAAILNDTVVDILSRLVEHYQVVHQTGETNLAEVKKRASLLLTGSGQAKRYQAFASLNTDSLKMAAGVANLVISRAGAGAIFEVANWGIPAIIIPIPEEVSHDQRHNAFTYARSGGAIVIDQANLTDSVLLAEINRLLGNQTLLEKMKAGAKSFARPEAGKLIAEEIIKIALKHES